MSSFAGRRRVVITGLGVVAPNGIGKDEFWSSLVAGRSVVDFIEAFDTSPFPSKIGAEVRSFNPRSFLSARAANTAARFSQFENAATRLALDDSKLTLNASLRQRTAICYGTSVSGAGDLFD